MPAVVVEVRVPPAEGEDELIAGDETALEIELSTTEGEIDETSFTVTLDPAPRLAEGALTTENLTACTLATQGDLLTGLSCEGSGDDLVRVPIVLSLDEDNEAYDLGVAVAGRAVLLSQIEQELDTSATFVVEPAREVDLAVGRVMPTNFADDVELEWYNLIDAPADDVTIVVESDGELSAFAGGGPPCTVGGGVLTCELGRVDYSGGAINFLLRNANSMTVRISSSTPDRDLANNELFRRLETCRCAATVTRAETPRALFGVVVLVALLLRRRRGARPR